jgi:hypothetical protein
VYRSCFRQYPLKTHFWIVSGFYFFELQNRLPTKNVFPSVLWVMFSKTETKILLTIPTKNVFSLIK